VRGRAPIALAGLVSAVGVLAAGCGAGTVVAPLPSTVVGTVPKVQAVVLPAAYKHGDPVAGKAVFLSAGCTGCHTLKDAGATGNVGPNLDQVKPPPAATVVYERVTQGRNAMPSFKGRLSTKQIADVIAYVVKATGGNPNG
jgi:cytochrome c6